MALYKKVDAINKYERQKDKIAKLFQEDINRSGGKRFYVTDPQIIYNKMIVNTDSHFYEFWTANMPILFSLDLDMKGVESFDIAISIVKKNIKKVCLGAKAYYNFDYNISEIIVLESNSRYMMLDKTDKYSFHVIFRGLKFQNYIVAKDFYTRLTKDYDILHSDGSIYNLTCLRTCYSCKAGKKSILIPIELTINKLKTETDLNTICTPFNFWLKTLITNVDNAHEITKLDMKFSATKLKILPENNVNNITNINIEEILYQLPEYYCNDYEKWIRVGMILYSISNEESSYFDLWNKWSSKSEKYKESEMVTKWNSFKTNKSKISVGTLIKWAKDEGNVNIYKNVKKSFQQIIMDYPEKKIEIKNIENTIILNQPKLEKEIFEKCNTRLLCIQSEKGTGKTSNLFKYLFDSKNNLVNADTTMLFVSSRRTFAAKLLGDLKLFGFRLYSEIADSDIYANKIICQLDSLGRLAKDKYDYVIIDECESLARYTTSSHFVKNPKSNIIISHLEMRVTDADKVIIMDADLSDRCMNYYKNILNISDKDCKLIINNYMPFSEYNIISLRYNDWIKKVLEAIDRNEKVVIPMASNNKAKDLKTKIELDFPEKKVLLIHKETDDLEKTNNLLNVNKTWQEYDIVIYTPSVCMGVSFDIPNYFDSIYGYGCENSLGAQEFCQMLHRVREPKNKSIYIAMSLYKEYCITDDTLKYEDIEQILCSDYYLTHYELHNNIVCKKVEKIVNTIMDGEEEKTSIDRVLIYPYKNDPNYDLFVRNSWESIENKLNFSATFYGYAKFKKYNFSFLEYEESNKEIIDSMKEIKNTRENKEKEVNINGILEAKDITKEEYISLIKQKDEYLEEKDIHCIQRYNFRKCYNINSNNTESSSELNSELNSALNGALNGELTNDLVEEYNTRDKMKWYFNLVNIMNSVEQTTEEKLEIMKENILADKWISNCYLDFTTKNIWTNHWYATNIIKLCGFDINNQTITIDLIELETKLTDCINYAEQYKKEIAFKFNLKQYNRVLTDMDFKDKLKYVNSIINAQYGLIIKKNSKSKNNVTYQLMDDNRWSNLKRDTITGIVPLDLTCKKDKIDKHYDISLLDMFDE